MSRSAHDGPRWSPAIPPDGTSRRGFLRLSSAAGLLGTLGAAGGAPQRDDLRNPPPAARGKVRARSAVRPQRGRAGPQAARKGSIAACSLTAAPL
jgi:hypothetical protein